MYIAIKEIATGSDPKASGIENTTKIGYKISVWKNDIEEFIYYFYYFLFFFF